MKTTPYVTSLAKSLELLLLDVDGVLTDGGIILYGDEGEAKRFNAQDGMGINLIRAEGVKVGIITSRTSAVVSRRAQELHIDELLQGVQCKSQALSILLSKYGITADKVAYVGDDIQDLPIMRMVGLPLSVANAVAPVKESSMFVSCKEGGYGAVREIIDWLLQIRTQAAGMND
ncbi:MAG: 3-deoxy-D-manno-octulosonate 8-phosphate phosphatase [Chloroflexi bacterium]|nr:3-deoxy-D-manno-octulosonate 8-phosphate phosphatase [Chloroflexota bacterium]|tara:strand:+ start:3978 stop:4499 length:522 start_codon:yes stop_codon:yes gene_type:complete